MKKVYIKTFGCTSNHGDSEQLAGILAKNKFKIVDSVKKANIIIVMSCGVKSVTQNRVLDFISSIPKTKEIYVGGCLPSMIKLNQISFDTNSITKIITFLKNKESISSKKNEKRISLPRIRKIKDIAIINIAQGCVSNCSYCSVKFARGSLKSYEIKDIVREVKKAARDGCKKIYITSQDNGCYGFDIKTNLPKLLKEIIKVKGDFRIRVGMANPGHVIKFLPKLIQVYKSDKIIKFLHIPVESGSDAVLKDMNRNYKVKDFKKIIHRFRKEIPGIDISTDIICGYPSETERDFRETSRLIKEVKPDVLNISKFGSRPGTKAAKLKQLPSQVIKGRSVMLTKLWRSMR